VKWCFCLHYKKVCTKSPWKECRRNAVFPYTFCCLLINSTFCDISMSAQQQTSELRENGCNGHSSSVPYQSPYESHWHATKPGVNPFVHRLQFSALDKLRVRIRLPNGYPNYINDNYSGVKILRTQDISAPSDYWYRSVQFSVSAVNSMRSWQPLPNLHSWSVCGPTGFQQSEDAIYMCDWKLSKLGWPIIAMIGRRRTDIK